MRIPHKLDSVFIKMHTKTLWWHICHRIDYPRLVNEVCQVLVMFSGKILHYSIPMTSLVMSLMALPVLPKAIYAGALGSMI